MIPDHALIILYDKYDQKYLHIYVNLLYYIQSPYMFRPPVLAIFREVSFEGSFKGYIP
jgi:hypothetical protein